MKRTACFVSIVLCGAVAPVAGAGQSCHAFLLRRTDGRFMMERVIVSDNPESGLQLTADGDSGIIDVVCPVGPGGSGSLSRWSEARSISVTCDHGTLRVVESLPGKTPYERPARPMDELRNYDTRVSVSASDAPPVSFLISEYEQVAKERVGPALDIFGGRIPTGAGDFLLYTDTYRHSAGAPVYGSAPMVYDRWPFVTAVLPGGREATFLVDLGAGTTVIARSALPDGVEIQKASMTQYSPAGKQVLKYAPGGATGAVQSVLGQVQLPGFRVGDMEFGSVTLDVLREMPDFFGRPVGGILGIDLLRRGGRVSFVYGGSAGAKLTLSRDGDRPTAPNAVIELPLALINTHAVVTGTVNDAVVHFIIDTGSPGLILDGPAADRAGVAVTEGSARDARGLDGGSSKIRRGAPATLRLGDRAFEDMQFHISDLAVFAPMRVQAQNVGLLGNSFFAQFSRTEIDLDDRLVRLIP